MKFKTISFLGSVQKRKCRAGRADQRAGAGLMRKADSKEEELPCLQRKLACWQTVLTRWQR